MEIRVNVFSCFYACGRDVDGRAVYKVSPEDFASAVEKIHSLGVNIIGGGTGPEHIAAVSNKLRGGSE